MQINNQSSKYDRQEANESAVIQKHTQSTISQEQMTEMLIKYIQQTQFTEYLRNNYHFYHNFIKKDLKALFKTGEIFRVKKAHSNMVINFNQPTVCVMVFGSVSLEGKIYCKGQFFITTNDKIQMFFSIKTTIVMLHKQDLQNKLYELQNYYFKKKQIQKILPLDLLTLKKHQIQQLIEVSQSLQSSVTDRILNRSNDIHKGIYLLYEGLYSLKGEGEVPFTEITCDYFGEEILWSENYQFSITANTDPFRFILIDKINALKIFSQENIDILKEIYKKKIEVRRKMAKEISDNLETTKNMIKKMDIAHRTVSKSQYKEQLGKVCRNPINKQWVIQKTKEGRLKVAQRNPKINSELTVTKDVEMQEIGQFDDQRNKNFNFFSKSIYKCQRAQSQRLFSKKYRTQLNQKVYGHSKKLSQSTVVQIKKKQKYKTQQSELDQLPKNLSVLLKYYQSTKKVKPGYSINSKNSKDSKAFLASAKSRRLVTNMKLHQQIFYKQFLQIKQQEDRAFKTWR